MKRIQSLIILFMALALAACSSNASTTPIPTIVLDGGNANATKPAPSASTSSGGNVSASAVIVPMQDAQLAFPLAGTIQKVHVTAGDQVKAGDILMELDNATIQLEVEAAQRTVRELTSAASIAAAEQAVANTQKEYDDAKKKADSIKYRRTDNVTINYLKDQVTLAQDALDRAREAYNLTNKRSSVDPVRAKAATNLYNAQKAYNVALGNLNWYANPPSETDVALAAANFDAANAALQEANWYLAELKGETIPDNATGAQLAQLQQARASLQIAQEKLEQTRLRASISGIVTSVDGVAGEYAMPGQALIAISDVNNLQVKTTDLSERDVTRVKIGDPAIITIDAIAQDFEGKVIAISPVSTTLGGDVVYEVTIEFTEKPEGLLGGMSAEVSIGE